MKRPFPLELAPIPSNTSNSTLSTSTMSPTTPSQQLIPISPPTKRQRIESVATHQHAQNVKIPQSSALLNPDNGLITLVNIPPAISPISPISHQNVPNIPTLAVTDSVSKANITDHDTHSNIPTITTANLTQHVHSQENSNGHQGDAQTQNSTNIAFVPKISTYNIRKNELISDPEANPLVNIHKITIIRDITEAIRLYGKMNKFCIGKETRNLKKIYVTSQSPTAGLCSQHIDKVKNIN